MGEQNFVLRDAAADCVWVFGVLQENCRMSSAPMSVGLVGYQNSMWYAGADRREDGEKVVDEKTSRAESSHARSDKDAG